MLTELMTVTAADGKALDGALYKPPAGANLNRGILIVHGLTWNFYQGPSRWLPPHLAAQGYTCLSINMRDHDRDGPIDFDLSHHDIQAGIDGLLAEGISDITLLAHGYGCNKAICFVAQSGNASIKRFVLITVGSVKGYRPDIWDDVLSKAGAMRGRTLLVQGAADILLEPAPRADEIVAAANGSVVDVVLLEGADHYFDTSQQELADCVSTWLDDDKSCGGK